MEAYVTFVHIELIKKMQIDENLSTTPDYIIMGMGLVRHLSIRNQVPGIHSHSVVAMPITYNTMFSY